MTHVGRATQLLALEAFLKEAAQGIPAAVLVHGPAGVGKSTLLSQGLTNRHIAEHMVVSVKSVEFHVSNVYRKVGAKGRPALIARIHGAAPSGR